jgi:LEA14-like dessication related protein
MEYKVTVAQGKVVWYKLYNGNAVPVMVSFYFSFISFHDVTITIALNRQYHLVLADCFL